MSLQGVTEIKEASKEQHELSQIYDLKYTFVLAPVTLLQIA